MKTTIATNLERIIKEKGLNPRAISKATGKNLQLVDHIISGKSKNPTLDTLSAIAREIGVPVSEITGEAPGITPDLNILAACFKWVIENLERIKTLSPDQIVEELMRQYGVMLHEQVKDKREAVRITRLVFESLADRAPPAKQKK